MNGNIFEENAKNENARLRREGSANLVGKRLPALVIAQPQKNMNEIDSGIYFRLGNGDKILIEERKA